MTKHIGHRGTPSEPRILENTLESFLFAAKSNLDGIETDIWPTKDNKLICCHDSKPFKHSFKKIYKLTYKKILKKKLIGSKNYPRDNPGAFNNDFMGLGFKVPLFEEYLSICKKFNKLCFIELKNDRHFSINDKGIWNDHVFKQIIEDINKLSISYKNIWFISLDADLLIYFKKIYPFIQILGIIDPNNLIVEQRSPNYFLNKNIGIDVGDDKSISTLDWGIDINSDLIKAFHKKQLKVGAWTINEESRVKYLESIGIDFITSDYIWKK